jgi:hypothetical protein
MKIEEGKYYRTRGGHVFGPIMRDTSDRHWPWHLCDQSEKYWLESGRWYSNDTEHSFDLVAEVYVSDTPPAPQANTTKTARDELVEKTALEIFKRFYLTPESSVGFDWMWRAAENFVEARKK